MRRRRAVGLALAALALAAGAWRDGTARAPADAVAEAAVTYQCPMHPQVVASAPGQCPVCGMSLSRVDAGEPGGGAGADHASPSSAGDDRERDEAAAAPSHVAFALSPEREQLIGVKTVAVEYREMHRDVRTAGRVAFDPDLYAALAEHLEASAAEAGLGVGATTETRLHVEALRRSAARRLALLGISSSELAAVARVESGSTSLLLPGQSAWVYATIYGTGVDATSGVTVVAAPDLPRVDQPVVVTSRALRGRTFRGRLITVEPVGGSTAVGSSARQAVRVRALVATPGGGLTAGSIVDLTVQVPLGRRLAIPEDALLDTGTRQLVFVRHADGRFEPRDIVVGVEGEAEYEVVAGLSAGEQVVAAATFLIDSESRFRAAQAALAVPGPPHDQVATAGR